MKVYDKRPAAPDIGTAREISGVKSNGTAISQPVTDLSQVADRLGILVGSLTMTAGTIGGALDRFDFTGFGPAGPSTPDERPDNALGRIHSLIDQAAAVAGLLGLQADRIANIA